MGTSYNKPDVMPVWAETANNPADIINLDPAWVAPGWPLTGTPPSRQRFNAILKYAWQGIRYLCQRGLPDYDAAETYRTGSCVIGNDGGTYRSLVDNNIGNAPSSSPGQWVGWALTLAQINASQLTQATPSTADNTTKVSTTQFVQSVVSQAISNLNASLVGYINGQIAAVNAAINQVQANLNQAITDLQAYANNAATNAYNSAIAQIAGGLAINLSTNGYIRFPTWASGFTIQWASQFIGTGGGTISWPTQFPNQCLSVLTTCVNTAGGSTSGYSVQGYNVFNVSVAPNRRTDDSFQAATCIVWAIGY